MRDLAFLLSPLPASESAGLASTDPRLAELTTAAERRDFESLERSVEALFDEGTYDVRAISFYLWAAFEQQGLSALPAVVRALLSIATTNADAVGPAKKRGDHLARRVAWLLGKIVDAVEYHEKKKTPEWRAWTAEIGTELVDETVRLAMQLEEAIASRGATAQQAAAAFAARLRPIATALVQREVRDAHPESSTPASAETQLPPAVSTDLPEIPESGADSNRVELTVSRHYFELVQKLAAFRLLVERGDFGKAAIVCDDVMALLEHFDPRLYFPELFSDFSALMSGHVETLAEHWEARDSLAWKAMVQFYRVDLRRFARG